MPDGRPTGESFTVKVEHSEGVARLYLGGELDLASEHLLDQAMDAAEQQAPHAILVDLSGLSFMDSTGLSALLRTYQRAEDAGRTVLVAGAGRAVDKLLAVSGARRILKERPDDASR